MYKIFVLYVMRMETHQKAHHYTWTNKKKIMIKILLFLEMRVTRKIFPGLPQIYFFNQFSRDILFPSLVFSAFCILVFFACLFVFWNWKYIFWYTCNCAHWWVIKNVHPANFWKQDDFFLALNLKQKSLIVLK